MRPIDDEDSRERLAKSRGGKEGGCDDGTDALSACGAKELPIGRAKDEGWDMGTPTRSRKEERGEDGWVVWKDHCVSAGGGEMR